MQNNKLWIYQFWKWTHVDNLEAQLKLLSLKLSVCSTEAHVHQQRPLYSLITGLCWMEDAMSTVASGRFSRLIMTQELNHLELWKDLWNGLCELTCGSKLAEWNRIVMNNHWHWMSWQNSLCHSGRLLLTFYLAFKRWREQKCSLTHTSTP